VFGDRFNPIDGRFYLFGDRFNLIQGHFYLFRDRIHATFCCVNLAWRTVQAIRDRIKLYFPGGSVRNPIFIAPPSCAASIATTALSNA